MKAVPFEPIDPGTYRELVRRALAEDFGWADGTPRGVMLHHGAMLHNIEGATELVAEDFGWGDVTTETIIDRKQKAHGIIVAKSTCVMAGIEIAAEAFRQLDPAVQITIHCPDGHRCERGTRVADIRGYAAALLTAERTALNFLQHLSGIATLTRQFVDVADGRITVLDTRKTTPIFRALEKYAVRAGGGVNHRSGLDAGILIKDNHIRLAGAEIILLDNLSTDEIIEAVKRCRGRAKTEISGGVTLQRMRELAATGADFVSVGALTHSAPAVDLSFEIEPA